MKKKLCLFLVLLFALAPTSAFAERAKIIFPIKVGMLYEGQSVNLIPKVANVDKAALNWKSSNEAVATMAANRLTAVSEGLSVISATAMGAKAQFGLVVLQREITLNVGSAYALPYHKILKYAAEDKRIAKVSSKGVITGVKAGTTRVKVYYGKTNLIMNVTVTGAQQSAAAKLDCADSTNQIVLVDYISGSKAELTVHEKRSGVWTELYSTTAYVGKNGIGKTKEGDQKTPTGTYNLTAPFGILSDPGSQTGYTKVTKYHYWCGTSGSDYYNQLVDTRVTKRAHTSSDEYLINYKGYYNYCLFIDYNKNGAAGKGSCIFLHCTGGKKSTAGCIAIPESGMKQMIKWVRPGAKIVIQ